MSSWGKWKFVPFSCGKVQFFMRMLDILLTDDRTSVSDFSIDREDRIWWNRLVLFPNPSFLECFLHSPEACNIAWSCGWCWPRAHAILKVLRMLLPTVAGEQHWCTD